MQHPMRRVRSAGSEGLQTRQRPPPHPTPPSNPLLRPGGPRGIGPSDAGERACGRTDTHLPYAAVVQRRLSSALRGRVARRGHFQVAVGAAAAAPGEASFGAAGHRVAGCAAAGGDAVSGGSLCRCKVDLSGGAGGHSECTRLGGARHHSAASHTQSCL